MVLSDPFGEVAISSPSVRRWKFLVHFFDIVLIPTCYMLKVGHLLCVLRVFLEVSENLSNHRVREDRLDLRVSHGVRRSFRICLPSTLNMKRRERTRTLFNNVPQESEQTDIVDHRG